VGKPRPEKPEILDAIEREQTERANLAAQATANARIAAEVEGERTRVALYGPDNAVLLEAIRSGKVGTFVVDDDNGRVPSATPVR
jgi:hypothetical protein